MSKKNVLLFSLVAVLVVISVVTFYYFTGTVNGKRDRNHYRIAVALRPIDAFEEMYAGLESVANNEFQGFSVTFNRYYANDTLLMTAMIEEALDKNYDMIISMGALYSQTAKSVLVKRRSKIPLVFMSVVNPAELGLVDSEQTPGGNVTGITLDNISKDIAAELVYTLNFAVKNVLIPYNPNDNGGKIASELDAIQKFFEQRNVKTSAVVIEHINEITRKLKPFLIYADAVLILVGSIVSDGISNVIKLCNQYRVPLIAYDINAAEKGAVVAYGAYLEDVGKAAAQQFVRPILHEGKHPSELPVLRMDDWCRVVVNLEAAEKQGLKLSEAQILLLKKGMVIEKTVSF